MPTPKTPWKNITTLVPEGSPTSSYARVSPPWRASSFSLEVIRLSSVILACSSPPRSQTLLKNPSMNISAAREHAGKII
ncbi:hypothetical protein BDY19DRAFT_925187 [Irpex rosettiformis]|uniref:Uncharacterized protein n=1 Tax=Irpex rosettiformis TaxID=378272 RepID=A0ACB8UE67_9APHY|nr:hypothetical protein BDY19DRAFT_925187 [Irpex rosettiformis]